MTNGRKHNQNDKGRAYVRDLGDGVKLRAEVSPCVFMYPSYPLQVSVTLHRRPGESLGKAYAVDRTKTAVTYSDADVKRLLAGIGTGRCSRCSTPAFDPATVETNRSGLCEACFVSKLESEFAASEEAEQQAIAASDRRMKQEGMVVRVSGWVHPQGGGDDYQVDWYLDAHPTPEQVGLVLRKRGSSRLDDYQIITL
jgi:hypothetical protein